MGQEPQSRQGSAGHGASLTPSLSVFYAVEVKSFSPQRRNTAGREVNNVLKYVEVIINSVSAPSAQADLVGALEGQAPGSHGSCGQ